MKELWSNPASRAWAGVALVGAVVVVLVFALQLFPRLGGAQDLIDAAEPALTDTRVAGERAGVDFIATYVDTADPLVTSKGGGAGEVPDLIRTVTRRTDLSRAGVRRLLKKAAPHTKSLLQALPLSSVTKELPRLQSFLSSRLAMSPEELQLELAQNSPRLTQALAALPAVGNGWNDIPGTEDLTRFDGRTPVRTVPALRDYLSADLVAAVERRNDDFQDVAGRGGVGYIPWLLLVVGVAVLAFGLLTARRALSRPPGLHAWSVVFGVGVVILAIVVGLSYFGRLGAADRVVDELEPAFARERVAGAVAGMEMVHQTVLFGDPIATRRGGGSAEVPRLVRFVSERTGMSGRQLFRALAKRAPRTAALLQAIPLAAVSDEVPRLLRALSRRMRLSRAELLATLDKRTPALARTLRNVTALTSGWNAIPGTERLTRFDGGTEVRRMAVLDDFLRDDVIRVLPEQREHFDKLADTWPPVTFLPPLLVAIGTLLVLSGLSGMMFVFAVSEPTV